jgi:hypothetical protein
MRRSRSVRAAALLALGVGALAFGVTACGGDDEPQSLGLELTSADGKFAISEPTPVEAGLVRFEYQNSTEEQADAQLLRIDDGHSLEDALAVLNDDTTPNWLHAAGGVGQIAAGATGEAELLLEEGTYYLVDLGEPEGDDVPSHAESGATAMIEVAEGDDDAALPDVDASIEMDEYSFLVDGLKAGANRFRLSNTGEQIHHTLVVPIAEGKTIGDVREFIASEGQPSGPPPIDFSKLTGTSALDGGGEQIAELTLDAGRYALLCFIPDREGGPPHVLKGMLREVTIEE